MINLSFSVNGLFASEAVVETKNEINEISITADKTHYVFPKSVEFFNWLFSLEGIRVSSFYSNKEGFNEISFSELPKLSLESQTQNIRLITKLSEGIGIRTSYNFLNKMGYKDLKNVLLTDDLLENAVLVDTSFMFVLNGQEKNFLHIPPTLIEDYRLASKKINSYDSSGYKPLPCILSKNKNDCKQELSKVLQGKCILITLENECFNLCFLDSESGSYKTESISKENNPELYEDFKACKFEPYKTSLTIMDEDINQKVRNLVSEFSGKTTKICRRINRICYLVGILSYALEKFNENGIPMTTTIFNLQHSRTPSFYGSKKEHYTRNLFLITDERLYEMGLGELRKINPNLNFSIPQS